jgi:hypothetical protein
MSGIGGVLAPHQVGTETVWGVLVRRVSHPALMMVKGRSRTPVV